MFGSSAGDGVNGRGVGGLGNSRIWKTRGKHRRHHPDAVIQSEHEELTHDKWQRFEELTIVSRFIKDG